jgi:hypothetical protein
MELTVPAPVQVIEREQAALVVTPHPLSLHDQRIYSAQAAELQPGETLASFLARHGVQPGQQWVVTIGGVLVHEMHWPRVRPKHGHLIECRRVPERDVLRLAAIVALTVATQGMNIWLQTAIRVVGTLMINKLLGPKPVRAAPEQAVNPTYSLQSGGQNQSRLWQPIGLVLGEPWMVPDFGAQPYTFFKDGEQHLWQVFNCGINCADFHTIRIGQTSLDSYQGVTVLRSGMATDNSAFPALGTSVDTVAGALLEAPTAPGAWVQRTSSAGTVRLAVDVVASLFSVDSGSGAYTTRTLDVGIEYRAVGSGTWLPFTEAIAGVPAVTETVTNENRYGEFEWTRVITPDVPAVPAGVLRLKNANQKPVRRTVELAVPAGQYEVRLSKLSQDYTGTSGANSVEWSSLKSYQPDTADYDGQARIAVQIQASGQLNGSLSEINGIGKAAPMPYWDGSAWVTATDRASGLCNPGAILLLLARGINNGAGRRIAGLGFSDDRIDIEGLKAFMVHCAAKGYHFDLYLQDTTSIGDLMDAVSAAGMGKIDWPDGKLGVAFYADDDPITGVINMGSIKARSFSVEYQTLPTADELELQYMDRDRDNAWTSLRATVPGVASVRSTARTQMVGVTGEAHAAALLRFLMGQNIYQRKTVTCELDLEAMTYRRGQVVALSHDLTQWGYGGRLMACEAVGGVVRLTLDDSAPGSIPAGYSGRYIGLRLADERQMRVFPVKPFSGQGRVIELDAAWPPGVPLPGSSADNPAHDCLWVYDFKATPGQLLRIASIEPTGDGARLTMVPESAEFWDYVANGLYVPPPNNSLLATVPAVTSVLPGESLARQGNTFYTELDLSFQTDGNFSRAELWGSTAGFEQLAKIGETRSHSIGWRGGLDDVWSLELRVFSDTRQAEPFRLEYTVQGLRALPEPFDVFQVLAQPDGTREFRFGYTTTPVPVDWLGAEIRYLPGTHTTPAWDGMTPLQTERTHYTASPVEVNQLLSGPHTFACRSLDTTGNLSDPVYFQITLPPRRLGNVVAEFDEAAEAWTGTVTSGAVNTDNNTVEAASTTTWDSLTTWDTWTRWSQSAAASFAYTSPVRDFGAVLTALVDVQTTAAGDVTIELRSSQTSADPVANPSAWTAWGAADAKVTARYFQLRVTVAANGSNPLAVLSAMSYMVSAPLLTEYINDLDISTLTGGNRIGTGDVRIPLENTYAAILELQVVIQDGSAGAWAWQLVDKTLTGPRVQFRLNGTLADPDLVDFIVKGF